MQRLEMHLYTALGVVLGLALTLGGVADAQQRNRRGKAKRLPTVAILYFDYDGSSEEMGFLRKGLTQMLVSDLADVDTVDIVERVRLEDALRELKLNESRKIDQRSANRVGKLLGARYLVMGGYFDMRGTLRIDTRVVEVETGKIVASMGKHGKVEAFLDLESHLAGELRQVMLTELKAAPRSRRNGGSGRGRDSKPRPNNSGQDSGPDRVKDPGKSPQDRRHINDPSQTSGETAIASGKNGDTTTVAAVGAGRRPLKRPDSLDAREAAAYGKALDAMDRGDREGARVILENLLDSKPSFELASLDLANLRK